jgi:hypothetical protein
MNVSQLGECVAHRGLVSTAILNNYVKIQVIATLDSNKDIDTPSAGEPKLQTRIPQGRRDFQDIVKGHHWLKWRPQRLYASLEVRVARVGINELAESNRGPLDQFNTLRQSPESHPNSTTSGNEFLPP